MAINDYALSCATDQVPGYFTYEGNCMIIVQSKASAKIDKNDFIDIEGFMPSLISHESIHVVITTLENNNLRISRQFRGYSHKGWTKISDWT